MENVAIDFKNHFNNYVQNLETYIMFQIKQRTLELTEELTKKAESLSLFQWVHRLIWFQNLRLIL